MAGVPSQGLLAVPVGEVEARFVLSELAGRRDLAIKSSMEGETKFPFSQFGEFASGSVNAAGVSGSCSVCCWRSPGARIMQVSTRSSSVGVVPGWHVAVEY